MNISLQGMYGCAVSPLNIGLEIYPPTYMQDQKRVGQWWGCPIHHIPPQGLRVCKPWLYIYVNLIDQGHLASLAGFLASGDEWPNNERSEALGSPLRQTHDLSEIVDSSHTWGGATSLITLWASLLSRKSWKFHVLEIPEDQILERWLFFSSLLCKKILINQ